MKVLLDECVPRALRQVLAEKHQVKTLHELGWAGQRNGKLVSSTTTAEFAVLVTTDPTIVQGSQLKELSFAIVVLPTNNWRNLSTMSEQIISLVNDASPGKIYELTA